MEPLEPPLDPPLMYIHMYYICKGHRKRDLYRGLRAKLRFLYKKICLMLINIELQQNSSISMITCVYTLHT